jgi:hypothetical protein
MLDTFCKWSPRQEGVLGEWIYIYISMLSSTSKLNGGEWSDSSTGHFTPREGAHFTLWVGGWVGPRASLDAVVKRRIPSPCWDSNPRSSSVIPLSYIRLLRHNGYYYDYHHYDQMNVPRWETNSTHLIPANGYWQWKLLLSPPDRFVLYHIYISLLLMSSPSCFCYRLFSSSLRFPIFSLFSTWVVRCSCLSHVTKSLHLFHRLHISNRVFLPSLHHIIL